MMNGDYTFPMTSCFLDFTSYYFDATCSNFLILKSALEMVI